VSAQRTTIAGIAIPDSGLAREAAEFVRDVLEELVPGYGRPSVCDDIRNSRFET
jgi:hypothetical protein